MRGGAPEWYKIKEISIKDYVKCIKEVYKVLEKKNKSNTQPDIFLKTILSAHSGMTTEQWDAAEKQRLYEKALSMKMGDFHEELMGKFAGYETLPVGHASGTDVRKLDDTEFFEVKNRDNTMNSSSAESVVNKLQKLADVGKQPFLVMINTEKARIPRFGASKEIKVMSGKDAYTYLSGRDTFFSDLVDTIRETFTRYESYDSLKTSLVD